MVSSYPLIKPSPSPTLLLHTHCNNVKLSSTINGTSTEKPLFTGGPPQQLNRPRHHLLPPSAAKSPPFSLNSVFKRCETCGGQGAIECPGCKGTGKNKKNGNIFERWKCFDCQGFGLKSCPECGKGGLTPEQRGER